MSSKTGDFLASILLIAGARIFTLEPVAAGNQLQLKLVNVVFRHGDRAPDMSVMNTKNPDYDYDFYPEGYGGLTNLGINPEPIEQGKLREYQLGEVLRRGYNDFLGEIYLPESVAARSTDYARTKMSLLLVLAALYPPRGEQVWNNRLNWQPIPTTYVTRDKDWLMIPENCPGYLKERFKVERTPELMSKVESFRSLMNYLTAKTGRNITTPTGMYNLYLDLTAEAFMNLRLPKWTDRIFPYGKLKDGILLEYEIFSYTPTLRRLNGGKLLYKMIEDMQAVKAGRMNKNRKIQLYSGHETNVAAVLQVLGVYESQVPAFSSAVIVEFYELNAQYFVKILHYLGVPSKVVVKQIPGCDVLCPFDKFLELLNNVTPSSDELACVKSKRDITINPDAALIQH